MASTSEYEQQQFWKDKPIEVILGDNSDWGIDAYTLFFLKDDYINIPYPF